MVIKTYDQVWSTSLDKEDYFTSSEKAIQSGNVMILLETTPDNTSIHSSSLEAAFSSPRKRIEPLCIHSCRKPLSYVLLQSSVILSPRSPTYNPCALWGEQRAIQAHSRERKQIQEQTQQTCPPNLNPRAKLLFICSMRDDTVSYSLLKQTLEEHKSTLRCLNTIRDTKRQDCSLMHLCSKNNLVQCMELLAQYGCLIDNQDSLGATPLFYACANGCNDAAAFLIVKGANVNAKDSYQKFPLLVAIRNQRYDTVDMLLLMKADLEQKGARGHTSLHYFAEMGDLCHVQYLIERHNLSASKRNAQDDNVLSVAVPHISIVQYLTSHYSGSQLLDLVKQKNRNKQTVIHICCAGGHFESLVVILTALHKYIITNNWATEILNQVDRSGYTPLISATLSGNEKLIALLCLCSEVDVDAQDIGGDTALHKAIAKRDCVAARILTRFGNASIHVRNRGNISCDDASKLMHFEKELFEECRQLEALRAKEAVKRTKEFEKGRKRFGRGFGGDPIRNKTQKHKILGNLFTRKKNNKSLNRSIANDAGREQKEGTDTDADSSGTSNE